MSEKIAGVTNLLLGIFLISLILISGCASSQIKALQKDYQEFARKAGLKDRELERRIDMLECADKEYARKREKVRKELKKVSERLSRVETELKDVHSSLQELDSLEANLDDTTKKTATVARKVKALEKAASRIEQVEKEGKESRESLDTLKERLEKVESDLKDFASEVGNLNASLIKIQEKKPLISTWRVLMETLEFDDNGKIEKTKELERNRRFLAENQKAILSVSVTVWGRSIDSVEKAAGEIARIYRNAARKPISTIKAMGRKNKIRSEVFLLSKPVFEPKGEET